MYVQEKHLELNSPQKSIYMDSGEANMHKLNITGITIITTVNLRCLVTKAVGESPKV